MVSVQPTSSMGMGLVSTTPHQKFHPLFVERPAFSLQHTANRRLCTVCANCQKFIGGVALQLDTIFGLEESTFGEVLNKVAEFVPEWQKEVDLELYRKYQEDCKNGIVPKVEEKDRIIGSANDLNVCNPVNETRKVTHTIAQCDCGERYCSEACRLAHWKHSHELLCVSTVAATQGEESPLFQFKIHAIEHLDLMLLAGTVISHLIQKVRESHSGGGGSSSSSSSSSSSDSNQNNATVAPMIISMQSLLSQLLSYCNGDFLEACRPPPSGTKTQEFKEYTQEVVTRGFDLLKEHFRQISTVTVDPKNGAVLHNGYLAHEISNNVKLQQELDLLFQDSTVFSKILGLWEYNNVDLDLENYEMDTLTEVLVRKYRNSNGTMSNEREVNAFKSLLQGRELVMKCLWNDEMTGNFEVDDDEFEDDDDIDSTMDDSDENGAGASIAECVPCGDTQEFVQIKSEIANLSMNDLIANVDIKQTNLDKISSKPPVIWPSCHGSSFSPIIARCNHSCEPNARFYFQNSDNVVCCRALRELNAGEEIFISYVGEEMTDVVKRRKMLSEYGFVCNCTRCVREGGVVNA